MIVGENRKMLHFDNSEWCKKIKPFINYTLPFDVVSLVEIILSSSPRIASILSMLGVAATFWKKQIRNTLIKINPW